ncbi:hypothetical protein SERLADRAFT_396484 [Serpula lacrymans var. lacrymans S7.9]|uniref:Uncharacterized protein n=1 Tax=Serpula lacrymans var. lacrymans (strain S7.9) TaxID=578457 RepID=F8P4J9_SERL9|nr:uncharacterized protein SERLADRAFT_396484 [Serpula lacrymans var. lacrymans S7.9]EGO21536.1 hypothetical protein SERLADRAFT_396484 [Serpula lacrymans var. lacrymans S7.9]
MFSYNIEGDVKKAGVVAGSKVDVVRGMIGVEVAPRGIFGLLFLWRKDEDMRHYKRMRIARAGCWNDGHCKKMSVNKACLAKRQ